MITVPHTHTRQHPYCNTSIHSINSIPHNNQQTQSARDLLSQQPRSVETTSNANINLDAINTLTNGTLPNTTSMQSDSWGNLAQYQPDRLGRLSHQRESSLSSMGSTGPASPYNSNTSNPQIAVTDSAGDDMSEMHAQDASNQNGSYYQMAKSVGNPYSAYQNMDQSIPEMAYPVTIPGPSSKPCADRGLLPAPELAGNSNNRSHPASVTSSIAGDSPATPTIGGDHEVTDKRRKEGYGNVPKLDRTMTDVYGDELYSPNFTITSTPPSQSQQLSTISPPNDVFSQRLSAANSQHLGVRNSPISSSHDKSSPFRPISPFANATNHDFAAGNSRNAPMNSAQRVREQAKFQQDGQLFGQQMVPGNEPETPKTISPKDAILEFNEPDGSADFPLFPPNPSGLDMDMSKVMTQDPQQPFMMGSHNMAQSNQFNYLPSQLPTGIQVPQQYPFVARMHPSSDPSPPHLSSSGSSSESGANTPARHGRPAGTGADGGTYTCTYHGCTLRFETPALLQKHKREGHRQSHGLTAPRQPELVMPSNGMTSTLLNSQAGPHRCDRINPSTGKPCNTVFSRPYDLTRHEDTIHNARKQKVRCDLCTEEKTFSRADALTRHYRVCHPDMELPGKHRRRAAA